MWKFISNISLGMIGIQLFFLILFYHLTAEIAPKALIFIIVSIFWYGYSLYKSKEDENGNRYESIENQLLFI
jgi:ABC-type multidrug transport system permease subunit